MHEFTKEELRTLIEGKLLRHYGRTASDANQIQVLKACAEVIRDIMSANRMVTSKTNDSTHARQVHYLSMEFLMGRSLMKNAYNLGIIEPLKGAIESMGHNAGDLFELEPDASLGNGGLGRLAACYLESMTTQEIPATGYSICYQLGLFKQKIADGKQIELADEWLDVGDAWLMPRRDETQTVHFGGTVETYTNHEGRFIVEQTGCTDVLAVPMDMLIAGYGTDHVNKLRLWDAKSPAPVNMNYYSSGEYLKAVEQQVTAETIAKVIYPADDHYEGKNLRLKQQYFFVSATVQSICQKHKALYGTLENFHEKHVLQINDTHPTLVIPELMRIFLDQEGMSWDQAWYITTHSVAYTNHTVLAEALEHWPQILVQGLLPRLFMIMCEINDRYLKEVRAFYNGDENKARELAIIWDGDVRMANLCVAACYAVNGVSALHSDILKKDVFHTAWLRTPDKFTNVTNGVDHRRWLSEINPQLDRLIKDVTGGDGYLLNPVETLKKFEAARDDASVLHQMSMIKKANKEAFAEFAMKQYGFKLNTNAIFDVQAKRLHEYKRQLLNVMHIIYLYDQIKQGKQIQPRTFLFGAKAASGYKTAKRIIELILSLSRQINNDPRCKDQLQVFFLENYRVSVAERLMPATEVSEQISTAGKEASGTGNMKFMMNGALTIGTEDGANVEMHQLLGDDNIFIFGLTADQVVAKLGTGYRPFEYYNSNAGIRTALDAMNAGFSDGKSYSDLFNGLLYGNGGQADPYLLLADFESYRHTQALVAQTYQNQKLWNQMSISNVARSGLFASDRSIADYANNIWHVDVRTQL